MRIAKQDIPVKFDAPGAIACQQIDFGDATGYGSIGAALPQGGAAGRRPRSAPDLDPTGTAATAMTCPAPSSRLSCGREQVPISTAAGKRPEA